MNIGPRQKVYIENSVVSDMRSSGKGGAIVNRGELFLSNVTFLSNTAKLSGGAIYTFDMLGPGDLETISILLFLIYFLF